MKFEYAGDRFGELIKDLLLPLRLAHGVGELVTEDVGDHDQGKP